MRFKGIAFVLCLQLLSSVIILTAPVPTVSGSDAEGPRPMTWCSLYEGDGVSSPSSEGWTVRPGSGTITSGISDGATVAIVNDPTLVGGSSWMQRFVNFEPPFIISARGRYDPSTTYNGRMVLMSAFTGNHSIGATIYPTHLYIGAVPVLDLPAVQGTWYNVTFDARAPLDVDVYVNGAFISNVEMYPRDLVIWDQPLNKPVALAIGTEVEEQTKGMVDYIRTTMCPLTEVQPKTPDRTPPAIRNVMFDDGIQAPANHLTVTQGDVSKVWLNATIDDSSTGDSRIWSANYSKMPRTWPGTPMAPADGALDSPIEGVTAEIDISSFPVGDYNYCVYARDYQGSKNLNGGCGILTVRTRVFYVTVTYIVPGCPEGSCNIHFEIVTNDPSLIFFRWDFNDDAIWDTSWLTDTGYDLGGFADDYLGRACAEGSDGGGGTPTSCADYQVNNVPPTVDAGADKLGDVGVPIDFLFNFSDPGYDAPAKGTWENFTATIDWGDGPPVAAVVNEVPGSPGGVPTTGNVSATHVYSTMGVFGVTVTICDDDGGCGSDTMLVELINTASDPVLLAPADGAWVGPTSVVFIWQFRDMEGDAQSAFRLQIDNDPLFPSPNFDTGDQSSSNEFAEIAFTLPDGDWYWHVRTMDWHGEWGPYSAPFVFSLDRTPPDVTIEFGQPTVVAGGTRYVTTDSLVWLNGTDAGIGGVVITYSIDGDPEQTYLQAFKILEADGPHIIIYSAMDILGNAMQEFASVVVDTTPPDVTVDFGSPTVLAGGIRYITTDSLVWLNGTDEGVGGIVIAYSIDGGSVQTYLQAIQILESDGIHTIAYSAIDSLGNTMQQTTTVVVDTTPPDVTIEFGQPMVMVGSTRYITADTLVWLNGTDAGVGDIEVTYSIDGGSAQKYLQAIQLLEADGSHTIGYSAIDSLGNAMQQLTVTVVVDTTPPEVTIEFGQPTIRTGGTWYITDASLISLNGIDEGAGVAAITYSIDGGTVQSYLQPFNVPGADGPHTIAYSARDSLGNVMQQRFEAVVLDTTGPVTTISLTGLERGYSVALSSFDDGVGVSIVYLSVDTGSDTAYLGPREVVAYGNHHVRAYAIDWLLNVGAVAESDFSVYNAKPLMAGAIGVVLLVIGLVMVYLDRKRKKVWGIAVAVVGIVEVVMAILSWMTGTLGIPPWLGVSIVIDIAMIVVAVVLCALRWRSLRVAGAKNPPAPPPPEPEQPAPEPEQPAPEPPMEESAQVMCPSCGGSLPTGSTFCGRCGMKLA